MYKAITIKSKSDITTNVGRNNTLEVLLFRFQEHINLLYDNDTTFLQKISYFICLDKG